MWAANAVEIAELLQTSTAIRAHARAVARTISANGQPQDTLYVFRWNRFDRKGQTCRVIARGTMNSCLLQFDDGFRIVTSRNALMRKK